jgi:hypothetical protein
MKGGFLETLTGWGSSISQGASDLWKKTKDATSNMTSTSSTPTYSSTPSYTPTTQPQTTAPAPAVGYGGRKTRRRRMRGGFEDNTPTTGLASHAASFMGHTAQPQTIVGGKTKRRHRKKSRKHRKH